MNRPESPAAPTPRALVAIAGNQRCLTLIEIMIVLTIMASIIGMVGVYAAGAMENARVREAETEVGKLADFVEQYRVYVGELPDNLDQLVNPPNGVAKFTSEVPEDPWGNAYRYSKQRNDYELCSNGPDGSSGGDDDLCAET